MQYMYVAVVIKLRTETSDFSVTLNKQNISVHKGDGYLEVPELLNIILTSLP